MITPGWDGTSLTVIAKVLAVEVPQLLVAVTLNVPLLVGVNVTPVVVLVAVPPPL